MQKRLNQFTFLLTVIAVVMTSAISTTTVFADDGVTTNEPTEPADGEDQPVIDEAVPTQGEVALPEEAVPVETVEEIIDQIPEGTDLVVMGEEGVEPLATEDAAQIILESDPIWCPGAALPNDPGCTLSYPTVTELKANLGTKTGAGTIYFTSIYADDDAFFNHADVNLVNLTNLTIRGGWNGATDGTAAFTGITTFNYVPLAIVNWTGNVILKDITVNAANTNSGIYVQTSGDITLDNTNATSNGFDGADLINYDGTGDVTVNGGNFSGNDQAGLYILSKGIVTLNNAIVDNASTPIKSYEGAIIDNSYGSGDVGITASAFNNNLWNGIQIKSAGGITLNNVAASGNSVVGAYLDALSGNGNILINNNSTFISNGDWGIKAFAGNGSITLMNVIEDGNNITDNGAWLKSYRANVSVSHSTFTENLNTGLLAVAGGQVNLNNVTASSNVGGNGAEVYSIYNFACFGTKDIPVNVNGGTYASNGEYGIYTEPGAGGSLNLAPSPTFSGNGLGNTFLSPFVNPCPPPDPGKPEQQGKPSKMVKVPKTGGEPVIQDCENFSSTTLVLETGTSIKVKCPFTGSSQLSDTSEDELPGEIPNSLTFSSAITVGLNDEEGNPVPVVTEGGLLTISFVIPEELIGKRLSILYWDPTANDGQGDWIELPLEQFGGASFPLHPDDPQDSRQIYSGLEQSGNTVSVSVNFPGIFALVAR